MSAHSNYLRVPEELARTASWLRSAQFCVACSKQKQPITSSSKAEGSKQPKNVIRCEPSECPNAGFFPYYAAERSRVLRPSPQLNQIAVM